MVAFPHAVGSSLLRLRPRDNSRSRRHLCCILPRHHGGRDADPVGVAGEPVCRRGLAVRDEDHRQAQLVVETGGCGEVVQRAAPGSGGWDASDALAPVRRFIGISKQLGRSCARGQAASQESGGARGGWPGAAWAEERGERAADAATAWGKPARQWARGFRPGGCARDAAARRGVAARAGEWGTGGGRRRHDRPGGIGRRGFVPVVGRKRRDRAEGLEMAAEQACERRAQHHEDGDEGLGELGEAAGFRDGRGGHGNISRTFIGNMSRKFGWGLRIRPRQCDPGAAARG